MKIQLISDLHTEFSTYKIKVDKDADVLVMAGDIVAADNILSLRGLVKDIEIPIIYVAGNHEFYCRDPKITKEKVTNAIQSIADEFDHLHFLDDESVVIDGVKFIGSTLWSDFNLFNTPEWFAHIIKNHIGDFHLITKEPDYELFDGFDCLGLCKSAKSYLDIELSQPHDGKTVVVTHFCCHPKSIAEIYEGNGLNPYFATDCSELLNHDIALWCHGHTHEPMDYEVNDTRVVCNPRGYHSENKKFQGKLLIDI